MSDPLRVMTKDIEIRFNRDLNVPFLGNIFSSWPTSVYKDSCRLDCSVF